MLLTATKSHDPETHASYSSVVSFYLSSVYGVSGFAGDESERMFRAYRKRRRNSALLFTGPASGSKLNIASFIFHAAEVRSS